MSTEHQAQAQIAAHDEVPAETHQAVTEHVISAELADVKRMGTRARKVEQIRQEHRDKLLSLMGANTYNRFRAYVAEGKEALAERMLPPQGPEIALAELERLRMQRR